MVDNEEGATGKSRRVVVVGHCNIIETGFWEAHPEILDEKVDRFKSVQMANGKMICYETSSVANFDISLHNI